MVLDVGLGMGVWRIKVDPNPGIQVELWSGQNIQQLLDILTLTLTRKQPRCLNFLHKDNTMSWSSTTKEACDETGRPSTKAPAD